MTQNVLILTEAGKDIGFGHYTRCTAIKEQLIAERANVQMLVYLNEYDMDDPGIIKANWLVNHEELLRTNTDSVVMIDSYLANENIYKAFSQACRSVIAIDDYNRIVYPVDCILNPNVFFSEGMYKTQTAKKCVGGKNYVILRKEFRQASILLPSKQKIENVLITIGGSDFRQILPLLIQTCLKFDIVKLTVISPEKTITETNDGRLTLLSSQTAAGMVRLMEEADLVISACGQTLHELASLGKPTIGICLDIDQEPNQEYYLTNGFLLTPVKWNDMDVIDKLNLAFKTLSGLGIREKIRNEGPKLINRNGVEQVVTVIKN